MEEGGLIGYTINNYANGDSWKDIIVFFNGNQTNKTVALPVGNWTYALKDLQIKEAGLGEVAKKLEIGASSAIVLFRN